MKIDTKDDHVMISHFNKDKAYRFKECGNGLYYLDIYDPEITPLTAKDTITKYSILYTVDANMDYFTPAEIEGDDRARDLQHIRG